jgi:hypothetical protein
MASRIHSIVVGMLLTCLVCVAHATETKSPQYTVTFLDKEKGKIAIVDDSLEPYFEQLQPMEMESKSGSPVDGATIEEKHLQCRKRYQAAVLDFAEDEQGLPSCRQHIVELHQDVRQY